MVLNIIEKAMPTSLSYFRWRHTLYKKPKHGSYHGRIRIWCSYNDGKKVSLDVDYICERSFMS